MHKVLITGGAGFIGQNLVMPGERAAGIDWSLSTRIELCGQYRSLEQLIADKRIISSRADIRDTQACRCRLVGPIALPAWRTCGRVACRSFGIDDPEAFPGRHKVLGNFALLKNRARTPGGAPPRLSTREFWHVSTDEV